MIKLDPISIRAIAYKLSLYIFVFLGSKVEENVIEMEIAKMQYKQRIDDQMKTMIREILFYSVFLILLLIVVNGQQNSMAYFQNSNLAYILTSSCLDRVDYVID